MENEHRGVHPRGGRVVGHGEGRFDADGLLQELPRSGRSNSFWQSGKTDTLRVDDLTRNMERRLANGMQLCSTCRPEAGSNPAPLRNRGSGLPPRPLWDRSASHAPPSPYRLAPVWTPVDVAQRESSSLPSWVCGFDSRRPLHFIGGRKGGTAYGLHGFSQKQGHCRAGKRV